MSIDKNQGGSAGQENQDTAKGFDNRIVSYKDIHKVGEEDFKKLVDAIDPKAGEVILDGCSGYGEVTEKMLEYMDKGEGNPEIYLLDESKVQVQRAKENLHSKIDEQHISVGDIRETGFPGERFDKVVIKMGVHELPQAEQPKIFHEVFRILKPGGTFVVWDLALFPEDQLIFQDIIREKDRLAGFDKLVENRYFLRHDELLDLFRGAGFENVEDFYTMHYKPSTLARRQELVSKDRKQKLEGKKDLVEEDEAELRRLGEERAQALAEYVRRRIPDDVREKMKFKDSGSDVEFEVRKMIIKGRKPVA